MRHSESLGCRFESCRAHQLHLYRSSLGSERCRPDRRVAEPPSIAKLTSPATLPISPVSAAPGITEPKLDYLQQIQKDLPVARSGDGSAMLRISAALRYCRSGLSLPTTTRRWPRIPAESDRTQRWPGPLACDSVRSYPSTGRPTHARDSETGSVPECDRVSARAR